MQLARLVLLTFLALAGTSWGGPVLVYKGTGKLVGKSEVILPGAVNQYVLIDAGSEQVATITYYVRDKQKFLFDLNPATYRRAVFVLNTGKTSAAYQQLLTIEGVGGQFASSTRLYRGVYSQLKASSAAVIPLLHPATIFGIETIFADTNDTQLASELRSTLSYQQKRSVAANDANQTIQQVFDALISELNDQGFD